MSDSIEPQAAVSPPDTPSPGIDPSAPAPDTTALPDVPDGPPPVSVEVSAGADTPPAATPAGDVPAAAALQAEPPAVIESVPATGTEKTSDVIDTQAAAVAALGEDSGLRAPPEPTTLEKIEGVFEHPHEALASLRAKLAEYGEEVHTALRHEIEWLHNFFDRL